MAVRGMLPKNRLGRQLFNKLKVYLAHKTLNSIGLFAHWLRVL